MENAIHDVPDNISSESSVMFIKPPLMVRIKATFVDTVVILTLMLLAYSLLEFSGIESEVLQVSVFILILMYEPIMVSYSRTLGQKLMGLQVLQFKSYHKNNNHEPIPLIFSIFRYISKVLLGWVSLLTIHSDPYGRAIHDTMARSVMTVE